MAELSRNAFKAKYNDPTNGLYKAGQSLGISSLKHRTLIEDIYDSIAFLSSESGFNVPFTQLFDPGSGSVEWDWDSLYFNLGLLVADGSKTISFSNQPAGSQATLFVKKTIAGDVTLTIPTNERIGGTATTTTILLSGATNELFKIDFYVTQTSGFQIVTSVAGVFTKIQHTTASNVLALLGNKLYRSTDNGVTWALWYTSPDTEIVDFDLNGSNGAMLTETPTSVSQADYKYYSTTDGGQNWTLEATRSGYQHNLNKTITYNGTDDFYIGSFYGNTFQRWDGAAIGDYSLGGGSSVFEAVEACRVGTDIWFVHNRTDAIGSQVSKKSGATSFTAVTASPLSLNKLYSISFATATLGIAVGQDSVGDPAILKSADGGSTWTVKSIDTAIGILRKVRAISATAFIVIGDSGIGHSTDSGENWTYYTSPEDGSALSAFDGDDILVCTSSSVVWKGFSTSVGNIFQLHDNGTDVLEVSTASGTITLNCGNKKKRSFKGSANITSNKAIVFSNETNLVEVEVFRFDANAAVELTWPGTTYHQGFDGNWTGAAYKWVAPVTGKYKAHITKEGSDYYVEIYTEYVNT